MLYVHTHVSSPAAADLEWYQNTTASIFNGLTPENRFKWPLYEPKAGQYEKAKAILEDHVSFAQKAGFGLVRGHTLEWGKGGGFW
jgi:GH35 family endo-1,4-beta-xylanase